MKCPTDGETLVMSERHGVEIDYCPKCRGVWLDRGELDKIIDKAAGEMTLSQPEPAPQPAPAPRPAPEPQAYHDPYRPDPRHDDGRRGHGRDDPPPHNRGRRYPDDDDDRWRKRKKRKSLLSEIFDFD